MSRSIPYASSMDAREYLRRQGWRGDGHGLSQSGNGIKKPLLISKKVDVLGVGLNRHAAVSDQWWMRAFDQGLKDLGTGKKGALSNVREKGMHFGGLYGRFVQGETVKGTITNDSVKPLRNTTAHKRKRDDEPVHDIGRSKKRRSGDSKHQTKLARMSKENKRMRKDLYGREVEAFIAEAIRRGLLAPSPNKQISNGRISPNHTEESILRVFTQAGLIPLDDKSKEASKGAIFTRREQKKALKKAAKRYLAASLPPTERRQLKEVGRKDKQPTTEKPDPYSDQDTNGEEEQPLSQKLGLDKKLDAGDDRVHSIAKISDNGLSNIVVIDASGSIRWVGSANASVPLDPAIWKGIEYKSLPKPVREARRRYRKGQRSDLAS